MSEKKEKQSKLIESNVDETKVILRHIIANNRFIQGKGKIPVASEIKGESGIGKTSVTLQVSDEFKLNHVKLNLAQIEELGDLVGFPIRQFEVSHTNDHQKLMEMRELMSRKDVSKEFVNDCKDKEASFDIKWIDEHTVDSYTKQGYVFTGKNRMSYCPPQWIADKMDRGGILILDDWNRADMRFIQAVMELVDRQTYVSWKLPKDWHIILTSNPDDGDYLVQSIDNAQRTRFFSINLKFDKDCWGRWAEADGIDSRCINFVLKNPEVINKKVNARSAVMFFNCISSMDNFSDQLGLITQLGEGSVGPEFTSMFTTFIHNKLDKVMSPEEILFNKNGDQVLKELKSNVGDMTKKGAEKDAYRADIASVITTRLINYAGVLVKNNDKRVNKEVIERLSNLVKSGILSKDLCYTLCRGVFAASNKMFGGLIQDKETTKFILQ